MAKMHSDDVIKVVKATPGLSDRQISDALFGPGKPQQSVNQLCRTLAQQGLIIRRRNSSGIIGNFIADENIRSFSGTLQKTFQKDGTIVASVVPLELSQKARELGKQWAESNSRPRLSKEIREHWDVLIDAWSRDPEMPLTVRKTGGVRGAVVIHQGSGREVILSDNSPAQWAFSCALKGCLYSLTDLKNQINADQIPFAFATKASEKSAMKYRATLASCAVDLNRKGWKLCHIIPVGLKTKVLVQDLFLDQLQNHFRLLLKPSNHFLVPKRWSGLGEIPEVIEEIRSFDAQQ